jgi:hypothetical protein
MVPTPHPGRRSRPDPADSPEFRRDSPPPLVSPNKFFYSRCSSPPPTEDIYIQISEGGRGENDRGEGTETRSIHGAGGGGTESRDRSVVGADGVAGSMGGGGSGGSAGVDAMARWRKR